MAIIVLKGTKQFDEYVKNDKVMVYYTADWCGPCNAIHPMMVSIANNNIGKVVVCEVNVDNKDMREICERYHVTSIPLVQFFHNGELTDKQVGACPQMVFEKKLGLK